MKNCGAVRLFWLIFWSCSFLAAALPGGRFDYAGRTPDVLPADSERLVPGAAGAGRTDRYISLAPGITETVAYLGGLDRLAAVTNDCDYPAEAQTKTKIGKYTYPDLEKIIALQPAVVLLETAADPRFKAKLRELGIAYREYDLTSLSGYFRELRRLDRDLHLQAEAEIQRLERLWQQKLPPQNKKIVVLIWQNPLMAAGRRTFLDDFFAALGCENIVKAPRYPNITPEQLYKADLIINLSGRPLAEYALRTVELEQNVFLRLSPRLIAAKDAAWQAVSGAPGVWSAAERQARLRDYRLLRLSLALLAGAALALSGLLYQSMLLNPLAEPYLLGVSSGAAVGALAGLLLDRLPFAPAAAGALLALALVYALARRQGKIENNGLILSGVMLNSFCGALIMLAVFFAGNKVNSLMFWLMGDLGAGSWLQAGLIGLTLLVTAGFALWQSSRIELLGVGDEQAESLGVAVGPLKSALLFLVSALTALVVASVGIIGFVGLIIPHVVKMLFGERLGLNILLTLLAGAGFLALSDLGARLLVPDIVLPVGIVTALLGAPFFALIYKRAG
ncbi:MAG: helical backbone metal receptor [Candidatus Margulisbacteria bacterium]|jgi:iron complex transport system permease protein|nr:helical backbone metal receptor [Candidatus Margulisiibacteriota bacterium]